MKYFRSEVVIYKNDKIGPILHCCSKHKNCRCCYIWDHWINGINICSDYILDETI